jgi:hypothetical protein
VSKICGTKSWKDRLLQKCFKDATGGEKKCIQSWSGAHIDWRWENLEHVLSQAIFAIPLLVKYFDARHFTEEGAMISRLSIFLADHQFNQLFSEMSNVITTAIGREASWLEGCYCHEEILVGASSSRKRRADMLEGTKYSYESSCVPSACVWGSGPEPRGCVSCVVVISAEFASTCSFSCGLYRLEGAVGNVREFVYMC